MDQVVFLLKGFDMGIGPKERTVSLTSGHFFKEVFLPLYACEQIIETDALQIGRSGPPTEFERTRYAKTEEEATFFISMRNLWVYSLSLENLPEFVAQPIGEDVYRINNGKPLGLFIVPAEVRNANSLKNSHT